MNPAMRAYGQSRRPQQRRFKPLPAAELVVVDAKRRPGQADEAWQERVLNDGSTHRVYKRWFTPFASNVLTRIGSRDT